MANQLTILLIVLILKSYILTSYFISIKKFNYIHESTVAIFLGIIIALIMKQTIEEKYEFDEHLFFQFLLPPIIFSAAFNLKTNRFFKNFGYIMFFGIIGSLITFFFISYLLILINQSEFIIKLPFELKEILLLACVLTSTDTVAAISVVKEQQYPKLNSILIGEGIVNDAISFLNQNYFFQQQFRILLFRTIDQINQESKFDLITISKISGKFIYLLFSSVLIGIIIGFTITLFFKYNQQLKQFPIKETSLIFLSGYLSYVTAEIFEISGIISLFVCGLVMAEYSLANVSQECKYSTHIFFESIGYLAEGFVFIYLGMSTVYINGDHFNYLFTFLIIIITVLGRLFGIFILPCFLRIFRRQYSIDSKELLIIWYSGLIKGVVAFALCINIKTLNRQSLIQSTIVIVLLSLIILSGLLKKFSELINLDSIQQIEQEPLDNYFFFKQESKEVEMDKKSVRRISQEFKQLEQTYIQNQKTKKLNRIQRWFSKIDKKYLQPVFVQKNQNQNN